MPQSPSILRKAGALRPHRTATRWAEGVLPAEPLRAEPLPWAIALRRLARLPLPVALAPGFLGEPAMSAAPLQTLALEAGDPARQVGRLAALAPPPGGLLAGAIGYELGRSLDPGGRRGPGPGGHRAPGGARPGGRDVAAGSAVLHAYPAAYWPLRGVITGDPAAARALQDALARPVPGEDRPLPLEVGAPSGDLDDRGYLAAVREVQRLIGAGDLYQANLSRGFTFPVKGGRRPPIAVALALGERIFAGGWPRFGAALDLGERAVLSSSPELLLRVRGPDLLTQPIKGTRPRGGTPAEDRRLAAALRASAKDRAEHLMIVDVARNDLGRVAEVGSVRVPRLAWLERLPTVQHLVSDVVARLRSDLLPWDAWRALAPAASITGAPKIRAMEVIRELEGTERGIYCGSVFAATAEGAAWSVAIRTATIEEGPEGPQLGWRVGGGIVADSVPERELEELGWKSRALLGALATSRS